MFSISFLIFAFCSYVVFPDFARLCSFSALNFINMIILNFYSQIIHQSLISLGSVSGDFFFFPVAPCVMFSCTLFFSVVIICVFEEVTVTPSLYELASYRVRALAVKPGRESGSPQTFSGDASSLCTFT